MAIIHGGYCQEPALPTETAPVKVTVNPVPTASFTITPTTACAKQLVSFDAVSNAGANYLWDFGDGRNFGGTKS